MFTCSLACYVALVFMQVWIATPVSSTDQGKCGSYLIEECTNFVAGQSMLDTSVNKVVGLAARAGKGALLKTMNGTIIINGVIAFAKVNAEFEKAVNTACWAGYEKYSCIVSRAKESKLDCDFKLLPLVAPGLSGIIIHTMPTMLDEITATGSHFCTNLAKIMKHY